MERFPVPRVSLSLAEYDRIREWGEKYEAMLDREYDLAFWVEDEDAENHLPPGDDHANRVV